MNPQMWMEVGFADFRRLCRVREKSRGLTEILEMEGHLFCLVINGEKSSDNREKSGLGKVSATGGR